MNVTPRGWLVTVEMQVDLELVEGTQVLNVNNTSPLRNCAYIMK